MLDGVFRTYAQSAKVGSLVRSLGWRAPVLPQSMYIFKPPAIGGDVTPHQDATFLWTEPRQTVVGLWLALEDASEANGCLWARAGSHAEPVRRQFARNAAHFAGNSSAPMMVFKDLALPPSPLAAGTAEGAAGLAPGSGVAVSWAETEAAPAAGPDNDALAAARAALVASGFAPLPVQAGDLVVIHGALDHASLPNRSAKSRHSFQLHAIEGPAAGVVWSPANWLQNPNLSTPFPPLHAGEDTQGEL